MRELVIWVDFFRSEVLWGKIGERQTVASEKTSQFIFGNCEKKLIMYTVIVKNLMNLM